MSSSTRIAIPVPTTSDLEYNRRSWPMYAAAVLEAGGTPVEVRLSEGEQRMAAIARSVHGVVLPGSPSDVDPALYGREREESCAPADAARESADRLLLEEVYARGKPLLGICYGLQFLNVWRGGTLVQDLDVRPTNHAAGPSVAVAHTVVVTEGSLLEAALDPAEITRSAREVRLRINSSHHQAVQQVGEGLMVSGLSAEDGVVEAVERATESDGPEFLLGVQWHPERSTGSSESSRRIFRSLVEASQRWQQR